jgi:exonuclease III
MRRWVLGLAMLPTIFFATRSGSVEMPTAIPAMVTPHAANEISLLTYNVQDLPWPLVEDRGPALAAIGQRLRNLRLTRAAPQLVVLQEAFSDDSAAMLRDAGYRYVLTGPAATVARTAPTQPYDAAFLANRSIIAGEGVAPPLSSGLMIASDYPVELVAAEPFPQGACAGYDCLANKSMMLVRVTLPGVATPVELLTTHLNAGKKSGTSPAHHFYAYRRQLEALDRFVETHRNPAFPILMAGDVNISHSAERLKHWRAHVDRWGLRPVTAMGKDKYTPDCANLPRDCEGDLPIKANVPLIHSLDWQLLDADKPGLKPVSRTALFGREADGSMLSDHIGYAVRYRISL